MKRCKHFETCNAPLCPFCKERLENGIWYPGEPICKRREFSGLQWIKQQKKLKKKANPNYYFTFEMLNRRFVVRKGIKGLSTERPIDIQTWLKKHRPINENYIETAKTNLTKARTTNSPPLSCGLSEKKRA